MKIEAGKYYRTRDGRKVGPIRRLAGSLDWHWVSDDAYYEEDGSAPYISGSDLIAEWPESPVRTVTRTEIVPGVYGSVHVFGPSGPMMMEYRKYSPAELRDAARIFTELADALEQNDAS